MEKELMSTKTKRKSRIDYRKDIKGFLWYVVDEEGRVVTRVADWITVMEVVYNGNSDTYNTVPILKGEFMYAMRKIQAKHGVKFSIKTEWGTNDAA